MKPHIKLLTKHRACEVGLIEADKYPTMVEFFNDYSRLDWLRWALRLLPVKERVRHACYIVRNTPTKNGTVWDLLTDERSRTAIETAERWSDGLATDEELTTAKKAAYAAAYAYAADADAAAYAAADAAAAAATASAAADAAAYATAYAYAAAADANEWQSQYIKSIDWSFCDDNND